MNTLYLDIFSGISGDMMVGALLDLGVDLPALETALAKLGLTDAYHLHQRRGERCGISGTKFDVHLAHGPASPADSHSHSHSHSHDGSEPHSHSHSHPHSHADDPTHDHDHDAAEEHHHEHGDYHDHAAGRAETEHSPTRHSPGETHSHPHGHDAHGSAAEHHAGRTFAEIRSLIERSGLPPWVRQKSIAVFQRIAEAEGKIHGQPPDKVHFHEVGAIDSIVDIVGICIALDLLGRPRILAACVVEGTGWVQCEHGRFPIPAPATLEILTARGIQITQCEEPHELVTPTGAALLAELVEQFGPMRGLSPRRIGYGLGTRENKTRPNVLRAVLCEEADAAHDWETDTVAVLETNLDDLNPEILGRFLKCALEDGALDVFHTAVHMKKNRPGVLLTVLCRDGEADKFTAMILRETSAFGVRRSFMERRKLHREIYTVDTPFGRVTVKLGRLDGKVIQAAPEFESCRRLAEQTRVPLKQIYDAAISASARHD